MVLYGPDVSRYQGQPDWARVRAAGCGFGIYKVSEGRTYEDPSHGYNRKAVPAAGLVPGGYHYLNWTAEYASTPGLWAAQARWYVSLVDPDALHFLDVEAPADAGSHCGVREWVAEYRRLLPGHALGVYTNRSLWRNRSRMPYDPAGLFDYAWHAGISDGRYAAGGGGIAAQYGASTLTDSLAALGYPGVRLWQVTDHAAVPGVAGACDGNAFQGTLDDLRALTTRPTGDDHMSADDVTALKDFITQQVPALVQAEVRRALSDAWVHAPVMAAPVGTLQPAKRQDGSTWYPVSPLNMVTEVFLKDKAAAVVLAQVAAATDTVEAGIDAVKAVVADDPTTQQIVDALAAGLPSGSGVTRADVHDAVATALAERISSLRIVTDPPPAKP